MSEDPNRTLGPFVEGLVMGLIDMQRLANLPGGWTCEAMVPDLSGTHALYIISPSGIRWRIRAEIEDR